ncbi:hypothetical protein EVAR_45867_1 [Eumeta japonica]|uniref:Uncharacterized protein n=1 Tax=Eumeta variegata TaxID=151549 RepID=A0A4C1WPI3_EUMVA|nr:hypothetical protein EVAR_45867_1 [Eumeta japonica]
MGDGDRSPNRIGLPKGIEDPRADTNRSCECVRDGRSGRRGRCRTGRGEHYVWSLDARTGPTGRRPRRRGPSAPAAAAARAARAPTRCALVLPTAARRKHCAAHINLDIASSGAAQGASGAGRDGARVGAGRAGRGACAGRGTRTAERILTTQRTLPSVVSPPRSASLGSCSRRTSPLDLRFRPRRTAMPHSSPDRRPARTDVRTR